MAITQINTHRRNRHGSWRDGEGCELDARRLPPVLLISILASGGPFAAVRLLDRGGRRRLTAWRASTLRSGALVASYRPFARPIRGGGPRPGDRAARVVAATRPDDPGWRTQTRRSGGPASVVSATRPDDPGRRALTRRSGGPASVVSATRQDDPGRRAPTPAIGRPSSVVPDRCGPERLRANTTLCGRLVR